MRRFTDPFFRMLESFVPPYNATPVERLSESGAVFLGKTNMDEFSMGAGAIDSIFGPTRNIWSASKDTENAWHIAGGSSGGSAVAVASGTCHAYVDRSLFLLQNV